MWLFFHLLPKPIQMKTFLLILSFLLFGYGQLQAQYVEADSTKTTQQRFVRIVTLDGDEFEGILLEQTATHILIRDEEEDEEFFLAISIIAEIEYQAPKTINQYHYNLQASRYFFGPNAFGMNRGEGYYQNNWILLNQVSAGITDRFTLGIGTVPLFLLGPSVPGPIWITPKFTIPVVPDQFNMAIGGLFGTILGTDFSNSFGVAYGAFTLGNRDRNINLSIGYGMLDAEWSTNPTFSLSGMIRLNRVFYLLTENYLISETGLGFFGGRVVWNEVGLDFGVGVIMPDINRSDEYFGLPWLGLTVPFKAW